MNGNTVEFQILLIMYCKFIFISMFYFLLTFFKLKSNLTKLMKILSKTLFREQVGSLKMSNLIKTLVFIGHSKLENGKQEI